MRINFFIPRKDLLSPVFFMPNLKIRNLIPILNKAWWTVRRVAMKGAMGEDRKLRFSLRLKMEFLVKLLIHIMRIIISVRLLLQFLRILGLRMFRRGLFEFKGLRNYYLLINNLYLFNILINYFKFIYLKLVCIY